MNWDGQSAVTPHSKLDNSAVGPDPLRRKVISALASVVDKHREVLEKYDQVVITIHLDWRRGKLRETVMALPAGRNTLAGE